MSRPEQASYPSADVHDNYGYRQPPGSSYAHWGKRVGAAVVDALTLLPFYALIVIVAIATHSSHTITLGTSADGTAVTEEVSDGISGIGFALIGLIFLAMTALPMLIIAAAIKLTSKGPVLFKQPRHGERPRPMPIAVLDGLD